MAQNSLTDSKTYRSLFWIIACIAILAGLYHAWSLWWIGDDIFVTFRYVDNVLADHGAVYNVGEYVEGYTHFLWFMLLTLFAKLGFDLPSIATGLGFLSFAGLLSLYAVISYKRQRPVTTLAVPFTALILALHYDAAIWATGGLETALFTLLLSGAFALYYFGVMEEPKRLAFTGVILVLATMTRPDGALFLILGNVLLISRASLYRTGLRNLWRELLFFNAPVLILYLPYFLWRYSYYGQFFPNTYYAKSGGSGFFEQGFLYLELYFQAYLTSLLFLLAIPSLFILFLNGGEKERPLRDRLRTLFDNRDATILLVLLCAIIQYLLLFVARVGGDFMYARFIIPVLPFIYFATEVAITRLLGKKQMVAGILLLLIPAFTFFVEQEQRNDLLLREQNNRIVQRQPEGISDERHYYSQRFPVDKDSMNIVEYYRAIGKEMEGAFKGLDVRVMVQGSQNILVYYAKFPIAINDHGLTDEYVAHLPLEERGRIGHEKHAPLDYLSERGVDFIFDTRKLRGNGKYRNATFNFPNIPASLKTEVVTYDSKLISELRKRLGKNVEIPHFEQLLDDYITNVMPTRTRRKTEKTYEELQRFYFNHNNAPEQEEAMQNYFIKESERKEP